MFEIDRTRRVSEVLRRELAMLIAREINDTRIRAISINRVRVSRDLKHATVYFSSLGRVSGHTGGKPGEKGGAGFEKILNRASGFLRRRLSQNAELRVTPTLRFEYDDSIQKGVEMSSLIDRLNQNPGDG